jgi:hypothetical protein
MQSVFRQYIVVSYDDGSTRFFGPIRFEGHIMQFLREFVSHRLPLPSGWVSYGVSVDRPETVEALPPIHMGRR